MTCCAGLNGKLILKISLGLAISVVAPRWGMAVEGFPLESAGGRFGFPVTDGSEGFRAAEGFINCDLPLSWDLGSDFRLKSRLDFTAGWLARGGEDAATTSAGLTMALKYNKWPLWLELGSSPTYISRHEFGGRDLGGPLQFNTHIGLAWEMTRRWRLEYRYQHISNAGIDKRNPGLNLQGIGLGYLF
jgi:hypothetical protein